MANKKVKIKVKFTHQQLAVLDELKREGKFGQSYEKIIPAVFREYVRHTFGIGGM